MNNQNSMVPRIVALVVILLVGAGALAYTYFNKPAATVTTTTTPTTSNTSNTTTQTGTTSTVTTTTVTTSPTSIYKDGTYSATGSYISPGGDEKIGVTVTLKDDVITAASVTPEPASGEGRQYQSIFQKNFEPLVVGKNIADVHLSQVSGSSLTSGGFNQALAAIEAQAKA